MLDSVRRSETSPIKWLQTYFLLSGHPLPALVFTLYLCLPTRGRWWLKHCQPGSELRSCWWKQPRSDFYSLSMVNTLRGECGHYVLSGILQTKRNLQADSTAELCFTSTMWDSLSQLRGHKNKNAWNKKIKNEFRN